MKKILSLILVLAMALSVAGCVSSGDKGGQTTTTEAVAAPASALEILQTVWGQFDDDEKFPTMGGDYNAMVDGAPGAVTDTDFMTGVLLVPETETANVTDAASLAHGMMLNNFTCGVFKVSDPAAFAEAMHTAIANNPWMCGMPEKMVIATISGGYVLAAFGVGDAMNPFESKLTTAYPDAVLVYSEAITG